MVNSDHGLVAMRQSLGQHVRQEETRFSLPYTNSKRISESVTK